jgi:predicted  nucleic acid-binding Zn-ribbon protein
MQWVCGICGFLHDEEELPDGCPVCGAPGSKFSEYLGEDEGALKDSDDDDEDSFDKDLLGDNYSDR